ncbi:MAG: hypothetical protein ACK55Z_09855, partial [bacterium]
MTHTHAITHTQTHTHTHTHTYTHTHTTNRSCTNSDDLFFLFKDDSETAGHGHVQGQRKVGGVRIVCPLSESAGKDRYLVYFQIVSVSGALVFGASSLSSSL